MLVNSACVLANCLSSRNFAFEAEAAPSSVQLRQEVCRAMASALLHSDALPALSHLLSSEAQRGPAQALLWSRGLTTCFLPLRQLISIAETKPGGAR